MDEERRRHYLSAMGVTIWEPRFAPARVPDVTDGELTDGEPAHAEPAQWTGPTLVAGSEGEEAALTSAQTFEGLEAETMGAGLEVAGSAPAVAAMDWGELSAAVSDCRACGLCQTRTQAVFGVGNREAALMIVGEAPGADEDRAGEPFVGRAGQLLNRMLGGIGFAREQVYIANVLKCRPPGNRDPKPEEVLQCEGYLMRQLALVQPRVILAVGRVAAQQLLKTDVAVGRLRGRWFELGPTSIPLRVTYHPAYLLRSPEQKAKAWEDLTVVRRRLDEASAQRIG